MEIVINSCYGGFGLSKKAKEYLKENYDFEKVYAYEIDRTHEGLVEVVR